MKFFIKKIIKILGLYSIYNHFNLKLLGYKNQKKFNIDKNLIKKIKNNQSRIKKNYHLFKYNPKISFVLTSYNHINNALENLTKLRNIQADEIIVCDDGSVDGAREYWESILDRPNEVLILSNELNEGFCLDRAFRSSKAEILCSLQDDDILPNNNNWVEEAKIVFDKIKDLVILGGNGGNIFDNKLTQISNYNSYGYSEEERFKSLNINKKIISEIPKEIIPNINKFMFVHAVNLGPMFIRRKFYNEIDGYNLEHIGIGNHMIGMDWDLCFRAWENNKYVGLYEINGMKRRVGGNMSSILSLENREMIKLKNHKYLNSKYNNKNFLFETSELIKKLNKKNW